MNKALTVLTMLGLFATKGAYSENIRVGDSDSVEELIGLVTNAGIESPVLNKTIRFVDGRLEDNRFNLADEEFQGLNLTLSHDISLPDYKDLQLNITTESSKYSFKGTFRGVMVNYSMPIPVQ